MSASGFRKLTFAQEDLWLARHLEPETPQNIVLYIDLADVNIALMKDSVRRALSETETLRICFVDTSGEQGFSVRELGSWEPLYLDFSGTPNPVNESEDFIVGELVEKYFSMDGRLFEIALIRISEVKVRFVACFQHSIVDAVGSVLWIQRVFSIYNALSSGRDVPSSGFAGVDELSEHDNLYRLDRLTADRDFWRSRIVDYIPSLAIPGHRGSGVPGRRRVHKRLQGELLESIGLAARGSEVPLSRYLVAIIAASLRRYTYGDKYYVTMPMSNRDGAMRRTPTQLASVVPMLIDASPHLSFDHFVRKVNEELKAIAEHSRFGVQSVIRDLKSTKRYPDLLGPSINVVPLVGSVGFNGASVNLQAASVGASDSFSINIYYSGIGGGGGGEIEVEGDGRYYSESDIVTFIEHCMSFMRQVSNWGRIESQIPSLMDLSAIELLDEVESGQLDVLGNRGVLGETGVGVS
ncbi:condensation domain-containing protein, partial [Nocardia sp. NPDC057272]|uniref:condensation domain-containing protein n=1 Tax=Nocardia sp. NPDC057272 TaxID=3346079 RepID=UPI00362A8821